MEVFAKYNLNILVINMTYIYYMDSSRKLWHENFFHLLMQAISFLTPLAVIFVVKIIRRTDKTEIKEACLGKSKKNKL